MTMDMLPDSKPMPSANDQHAGTDDYSKGFVIEITVKADGSLSVAAEPLAEEASEEQAGMNAAPSSPAPTGEADDSDSGQSVQNWQDAMRVASDLYRNKGQLSQGSPDIRQQMYDQAPSQRP